MAALAISKEGDQKDIKGSPFFFDEEIKYHF